MQPKKRTLLIALSTVALLSACSPRNEQAPNSENTSPAPSAPAPTAEAPATPTPKSTATPNPVASLKLSQAVGQRIIYAYYGFRPLVSF